MKKILLLSDTHSYIDDRILHYAQESDETWHAGDIGNLDILERLEHTGVVRAVYGNIDDKDVRAACPEHQRFVLEGVSVWITHIGGYPPKYNTLTRDQIKADPPRLFICGHSHILKVVPDSRYHLLHMNPGAAGKHGFHKVRTMLRFELKNSEIKNLEVIELGNR